MLSIKRLVARLAEPYLINRNFACSLAKFSQSFLLPCFLPSLLSPLRTLAYLFICSLCLVFFFLSRLLIVFLLYPENMIGHSFRFNRRNIVAQSFRTPYIIPPMPPPGIAGIFSFSGMSATSASVTRTIIAMLAAFSRALRTTLVGSMMPFFIMSPKSSASAS